MCWNSQSSVTLDNFDKTSFRWLTWNGSSGTPVVFYSLFNCHDPAPSHGRKANRKVHRKLLNNTSIGWKWAARYWRSNYRRSSAPLCNAINSLSLSLGKQYLRDRKFRRRMGNDVRRCALVGSLTTPCFRNGTKQSPRPFHVVYRSIKGPFRSLVSNAVS